MSPLSCWLAPQTIAGPRQKRNMALRGPLSFVERGTRGLGSGAFRSHALGRVLTQPRLGAADDVGGSSGSRHPNLPFGFRSAKCPLDLRSCRRSARH